MQQEAVQCTGSQQSPAVWILLLLLLLLMRTQSQGNTKYAAKTPALKPALAAQWPTHGFQLQYKLFHRAIKGQVDI